VTVCTSNPDRAGVEIYDYLAEAAALVTVISSTALDAMAVDVPVISVLLDADVTRARMERIEFLARKTVKCVASAQELSQAVIRLVSHGADSEIQSNARSYANEQFHHRGRSSVQSADEIIALCGGSAAPAAR
jgi:CDP-glycerol glycerophosphotransferase (TagB/SpsB family)